MLSFLPHSSALLPVKLGFSLSPFILQRTSSRTSSLFLPPVCHLHPVLCLVAQSCPTLCDPVDCSPPGSSVYRDSPGKNTGIGFHALLQEIFLTQGSNPSLLSLLHCRQILYQLSYQGSPISVLHIYIFSCQEVKGLLYKVKGDYE